MNVPRIFALVSLTLMATVVTYVPARCPNCQRRVVDFPTTGFELRPVTHPSGRGPAVLCQRCKTLCEIIEHRAIAG